MCREIEEYSGGAFIRISRKVTKKNVPNDVPLQWEFSGYQYISLVENNSNTIMLGLEIEPLEFNVKRK